MGYRQAAVLVSVSFFLGEPSFSHSRVDHRVDLALNTISHISFSAITLGPAAVYVNLLSCLR